MKLNNILDKIGLGSIGLGLDGLFVHSELTKWMDNISPNLIFLFIKIFLLVLGIYLIRLYNTSKTLENIDNDLNEKLKRKNLIANRISKFHWYTLIVLCFLSISMNWGNEEGSGMGIAIIISFFWLIIIWPLIYFWKKRLTKAQNTIDFKSLTQRENLINYLITQANSQFKKIIRFFLILIVIGPFLCAIFPSLIGASDPGDGFASCLLFLLMITLIIWITGLFKKRKNRKTKHYYLTNPDCKVWASEKNENSLNLSFDDNQLEIATIFLPFSIEDCIRIINSEESIKSVHKIPTTNEIAPDSLDKQTEIDNLIVTSNNELNLPEYQSPNSYNIPLLIFYSSLLLPFGLLLCFIYSYLIWYIPFPYFNVIITAILGVLIGFVYPVKLSKCTNSKVAVISIIVFAVACFYFSWGVWLDLFLNQNPAIEINNSRSPIDSITISSTNFSQVLYLLTQPSTLFYYVKLIAEDGYYTIFSYSPTGLLQYFIWIIEFGIFLFFSIFISSQRAKEPFSIKQNKWFKSFKLEVDYTSDVEFIKTNLVNSNLEHFKSLPPRKLDSSYYEFEIWHLENEDGYLSLKSFIHSFDEKGNGKFEEQEVFNYVKISVEMIKNFNLKVKE